ncbi:MAG: anti-sigma factor family protein [Gemmatimonadaceae bacterium]
MPDRTVLTCEDALRLIAQYLDRELGDGDRADLEQHLATCRSCYSRAEFERRLKEELTRLGVSDVPTTLHSRIHTLLGGAR